MKKKILSSHITQGTRDEHIPDLADLAKNREPAYVCMVNVHMLIEAHNSPEFQEVVNQATYAFPDGAPVAKMFKRVYGIEQERIAGMDFFPYFLGICNEHGFKVALIGSTDEVLGQIKDKVAAELPQVEISCAISPPFGEAWDNEEYIRQINQAGTNVVFVALGCPKQEKWMHQFSSRIHAPLFGVGGAFPVYVGQIKRAPVWMQRSGLEWLYRLLQEPGRMFKRYFYTNSYFLYLAFRQIMNKQ